MLGYLLRTINSNILANMKELNDKTILLTGASSGIGRQIAMALLQFRVRLLLVGRNQSILESIKSNPNNIAEVQYKKVDLSNDADLLSFLEKIKKNGFELDILIHCAGVYHHGGILDTPDQALDHSYKVNFRAPFIITRELLNIIKKKKGQILFINTTAILNPGSNNVAYASIKGALRTMAEAIHQEVYPFGVRVTNLYLGRVDTPMQKQVCESEGKEYIPKHFLTTSNIADSVIKLLTLPPDVQINNITIRPI